VAVTGAAGQIGYAILPLICSGKMLGCEQRIALRLLDIPQCVDKLKGVAMELDDCAYPLVTEIRYGADPREMLANVDIGVFVGGFPRKAGMERKELLSRNMNIFKEQGLALQDVGKETIKCLVVANPANTNCMVLSHFAPKIPKKNFTALTRLDHNRAMAQIAQKVGAHVTDVKNVAIWGNHSATQYPDVNHGTVRGTPIRATVNDDAWLNGAFISTVQKRGAAIIEARGLSSAFSAAWAAVNHIHDWVLGTKEGEWVSMGVMSTGLYGIAPDICYSYPCTCANGEWTVVEGLAVDDFSRGKMTATQEELLAEKGEALENA
jgi:NAD-dependent malate dehydrogenase